MDEAQISLRLINIRLFLPLVILPLRCSQKQQLADLEIYYHLPQQALACRFVEIEGRVGFFKSKIGS
jgi:hypothetical protein